MHDRKVREREWKCARCGETISDMTLVPDHLRSCAKKLGITLEEYVREEIARWKRRRTH